MRIVIFASLTLALILLWSTANARQHLEGSVSLSQPLRVEAQQLAESRLNQVYTKLLNALEGEAPRKLAQAQQTWDKYHTAECQYLAGYSPSGLLHPMSVNECLTELTNERTTELQNELVWLKLLQPGISKMKGDKG